jgi:hypothetical protein
LTNTIKNQFQGYTPDVPPHIWDNIMAKRERRPKGFWVTLLNTRNWMIAAGLLLITGTAVWWLLQKNNQQPPVHTGINSENVTSNNTNILLNQSKTQRTLLRQIMMLAMQAL